MATDPFSSEVEKATITQLSDPENQLILQWNPNETTETGGTEYGKQKVIGLSHQNKQFSNTKDEQLKFEVTFNAILYDDPEEGLRYVDKARKFIKAVCRPQRSPGDIGRAGAPELLFVWPGFMTFTGFLDTYSIKGKMWNSAGNLVKFTAELTFENIRHTLITSDELDREDPLDAPA